jgi:hypothetical protein
MIRPRIAKVGDRQHPWLCWWHHGYGFCCAFSSWQEALWYALEITGGIA